LVRWGQFENSGRWQCRRQGRRQRWLQRRRGGRDRPLGAERGQPLGQGLFKLLPELFGFIPDAGRGALAEVLFVDLPADPLGAAAAAAEAVSLEFAIGRVTGKNGKNHWASRFSRSFARTLKWVK
jgi:hypothetical protein